MTKSKNIMSDVSLMGLLRLTSQRVWHFLFVMETATPQQEAGRLRYTVESVMVVPCSRRHLHTSSTVHECNIFPVFIRFQSMMWTSDSLHHLTNVGLKGGLYLKVLSSRTEQSRLSTWRKDIPSHKRHDYSARVTCHYH